MHKIKVLHVISGDLWAGAEVQAFNLLSHLNLSCDLSVILLNRGELANRLAEKGIATTIIDENDFSAFSIFLKIRRILNKTFPDIIHTHRQKENTLTAFANYTTIRAKCIRTQHGAPEFKGSWKVKVQRLVDVLVGRYLQHAIIAVSSDLKSKLRSDFNEHKITVISNGVDVDILRKSTSKVELTKTSQNKKHIGIIGRLVPVKRVDLFLDIAKKAKSLKMDYVFHIIGDGPLRETLEAKRELLNINDLVEFHGHRNDIASCIKFLDAVLICSDHEGMPMIALEVIALETPLITTDIPPFDSFKAIERVKPTDDLPLSFLSVIQERLLVNSKKYQLESKYTAKIMSEKTSELYKKMLTKATASDE